MAALVEARDKLRVLSPVNRSLSDIATRGPTYGATMDGSVMIAEFDPQFAQLETRALAIEVQPLLASAVSDAYALVRRRARSRRDAERLLAILGLVAESPADSPTDRGLAHGCRRAVLNHHSAREPLCGPCEAWFDGRYERTRIPARASCGSEAGARRHERLCEPVCEGCRLARNHSARARYHRQNTASRAQITTVGRAP